MFFFFSWELLCRSVPKAHDFMEYNLRKNMLKTFISLILSFRNFLWWELFERLDERELISFFRAVILFDISKRALGNYSSLAISAICLISRHLSVVIDRSHRDSSRRRLQVKMARPAHRQFHQHLTSPFLSQFYCFCSCNYLRFSVLC